MAAPRQFTILDSFAGLKRIYANVYKSANGRRYWALSQQWNVADQMLWKKWAGGRARRFLQRDLAKAEVVNESYLGRVVRLTLLSPSIIEAILEGRQPPTLELEGLLKQFPVEWDKQLETLSES